MLNSGLRTSGAIAVLFLGVFIALTFMNEDKQSGEEKKMSCCPEGSWGELKNSDYKTKGKVETVGDTQIQLYLTGSSDKCLIFNYDIFGFDGGRTRQMADWFADQGYMVIIPDYYRGTFRDPADGGVPEFIKEHSVWEGKLKEDWERSVLPYAIAKGAKVFGSIGTCWGNYVTLRQSAYDQVKAGVSMHPSHPIVSKLMGITEEDLLRAVKSPQLFMPSGQDSETVKHGGLAERLLGDKLEIVEFPEMLHGWTVRGDLSVENVERDVKKAFGLALQFFNRHLKL